MTTIKDIARLSNVSRSTVSRVLNDNGYVSKEARERVLKAVKETGYIPSTQAKALRTKKSQIIGVILPKISTETASRVVTGISDELSKNNIEILLVNTQLNEEKEIEYIKLLRAHRVDGIILLATNTSDKLIKAIESVNIPFIALGQDLKGIMSLVYDDYNASLDIINLLVNKGYKKIAFIGVDEKDRAVGYLRKKAYLDVLSDNGLEVNEDWIQKGDFSIESGYESMKKIIDKSLSLPSAVFAVTDRMAIGAMKYLKEKGFDIPNDMAIVGIGNSEISKHVTPTLTTIDYNNEEAGRKTARLLLEYSENNKKNIEKSHLNYRLIVRDSV